MIKLINMNDKFSKTEQKERKIINPTDNKNFLQCNNSITNMNIIQTQETSTSNNILNNSIYNEKEIEFNFQNLCFSVKQIKEYTKKISFQRKKDKKILEFDLFKEEIIFKNINKSYLQDEKFDDGDDSSEDKIKLGKSILHNELEEHSRKIIQNIKYNKDNNLLNRKIKFNSISVNNDNIQ